MGIQVLLYVGLGKLQTYSFFLPWKLGQKLSQLAAAFREVCSRALLMQVLPVIFLCYPVFYTGFVRLPQSGGRICVAAPISKGLDLSRPREFCPERIDGLNCFVEGCSPGPGVSHIRRGVGLPLILS